MKNKHLTNNQSTIGLVRQTRRVYRVLFHVILVIFTDRVVLNL